MLQMRIQTWLPLLCLACLVASGCATSSGTMIPTQPTLMNPLQMAPQPAPPTPTAGTIALTILHTNDVSGEIEPCGWGVPKGGLARRASFIKDQRLAKNNILVVDSGSALYATQEPMKSDQGKFTVHAMNMMGYDALNLGYRDLLLGKAVIEQRIAEANFAVLSANAEDMVTGELLALPYVIQMIEGHRVGIIGLTENPGPIPVNYEASKEIKITDPLEALRRYLPEVIETADVVILLSHLGLETDKAIAAEMPEIDAIIGGSSRNLVVPTRYEDLVPIIAQAGYQGEWIGVMNLTLDSQGKVMVFDGATASLTEKYADDPEMRKAVDRFLNH